MNNLQIDTYHQFVATRITSDFIYCANRCEVVEFNGRQWFITRIIKEPEAGLYLTEADQGVLDILDKLEKQRRLNKRMLLNPEKFFYCRDCFQHKPIKGRIYGIRSQNEMPEFHCAECAQRLSIVELVVIRPRSYNKASKFHKKGEQI